MVKDLAWAEEEASGQGDTEQMGHLPKDNRRGQRGNDFNFVVWRKGFDGICSFQIFLEQVRKLTLCWASKL